MSSPSQRRGSCGHMMAGFDLHGVCARCRDKKKGKDPCVEKPGADCPICISFTPEQLTQLSTPTYKNKKEKRDQKSSTPANNPSDVALSPTLVDPSLVTVMGVVDGQPASGPSDLSEKSAEKKKKKEDKVSSSKPVKSSHRPSAESTDQKLEVMEQKWSDRFNRLEALLLAKTLDREPTFSTVKVTPTHAPPATAISSEPFIKPPGQSSSSSQPPAASMSPATGPTISVPASKAGSDSSQPAHRPGTSKTTDQPAKRSFSAAFDTRRDTSSSDSDSESTSSDRPPIDLYPEEGELSDDPEVSLTDPDQSLSEEQSYRETMRGIRSYMGWTHVPDMDSGTKTSDDNPFAGPKLQTPGKVSVNLPTDEWLSNKLSKLNLTLVQGYPSRTTEAGSLQRDQVVRPAKSQSKWYGVHSESKKDTSSTAKTWNTGSSRINSTYLRIARQAGIASNPPLSRPISQENLRKPAQPAQSADTALQSDPSLKSDKSKSPCLAPRATKIREQGFSETVAARIEAPQRRSTRSVYEAKWAIFTKWCVTNQVDFRSPPVKSVADFLMYLFEDKKLQPSTIDVYRSAIADKLGNTTVNISKDDNLTRLLESFHRDRPKGRRGIPSWNLSLVLHQLTKAPFEPLREASLKHLTFKTVFLLVLGSGKRRSEIHAWQHKNIRHQSDWSKVSLFPSPSFLSKNQLAKEGPESVAPVVIPALAPTLDKSLKSDRSLCPVRALRYYLDRTSDLRQHKELVFVSFKKGFDKDISPATISSWIKQTVILCYELSDHQAHTLHQVKAHDVRAFTTSKAFQSGVSLEQILSACHWKSHNTFTQFYLKDVAWADSELYHVGPVVAAQQIHQQTGT